MSQTAHFQLEKVDPGGKLSDDGYAFTTTNMDVEDALFWRLFQHHHNDQSPADVTPINPLLAVMSNTGGSIPASKTVRYKYTLVDVYGTETSASPEVSVTMPSPIAAPLAASLSTLSTGGTLLNGTYGYVLTAYTGTNTNETTQGGTSFIALMTGSTNSITVIFPSVPAGASGFNIYRRAPGEVAYSYLVSVDMSGGSPPSSYFDDGTIAENCNRLPSNSNQTNSTNSVTVTFPGATPTVPEGYTWKLYRTYINGNYDTSFLTSVVEETSVGSGIITPTFTDTGISTSSGKPPAVGIVIPPFTKINLTAGAEVMGVLPPGMSIDPYLLECNYDGTISTGASDYIWVCDFDKAQIVDVRCYFSDPTVNVASQDLILTLERYIGATPAWTSIYGSSSRRARVQVGHFLGAVAATASSDNRLFNRGDYFRFNVVQAPGGDVQNLTINVRMYVDTNLDPTFVFDGS